MLNNTIPQELRGQKATTLNEILLIVYANFDYINCSEAYRYTVIEYIKRLIDFFSQPFSVDMLVNTEHDSRKDKVSLTS